MSLESATTIVSTHRSLLTERCERDWAWPPPLCCSLSHSSLSLSTWTELLGASTAGIMGEITCSTLVTYPCLTQKKYWTSALPHTHTHIQIHTLNSTWAGCFLGLNISFISATFCGNLWIDYMGLWSPCRIIRRFLGGLNKIMSLWQGEEASLRKIKMTQMNMHCIINDWSLGFNQFLNHFLFTDTQICLI